MIVYGPGASPYMRKVLAFAAEKGVPVEHRHHIRDGAPDPEFLKASPFRKVPALRDGDFYVSDSTAIVAYIEKLHPRTPLVPSDPQLHARTIWFEEFADTIMQDCGRKMFFNRIVAPLLGLPANPEIADKAQRDELPPILAYLESVIPDSGFLVDGRLTLADIAVASPFQNLRHMDVHVDAAEYPKLAAWVAAMLARPAFADRWAAERRELKLA